MLEENILAKTLNLESLDLSYNKLEKFSLKSDNNFRRLSTLNLAYNYLTIMDKNWQTSYPTLRLLNVSHNQIGPVIKGSELQFKKHFLATVVDLSFNKIEIIMIEDNFSNKSRDIQSIALDIHGNPIRCDCFATELKQGIEGKLSDRYFYLISDALDCQLGNSLRSIDYRNLNCPLENVFPEQNCGDFGCSCSLNKYYKEVTINCSSSDLSEFPMEIIELPDEEYDINLDISDNNIEELPKNVNVTNYDNIKFMNISSNKLQIIDHQLLPRELQYLSLRSEMKQIDLNLILFYFFLLQFVSSRFLKTYVLLHLNLKFDICFYCVQHRDNDIQFLSEATVEFLEKHINKSNFHMKLGLNPYNCNCKAEFLHNFIDSHNGKMVEDRNDVFLHCSSGPLQLTAAQAEDFCTSIDRKLMPIIAFGATLLALFCLLTALFTCNKQRILIYLYSKSWSRRFFNEDYIDKDKHFDAFISYSHEDKEYVETTLLTGLETATDSEFRYKVCVHSRDWNVGEDIPSQIFRSVQDSRKTIIVLSQNYIESKWSDMEFKAAHKKALIDKIQVILNHTV